MGMFLFWLIYNVKLSLIEFFLNSLLSSKLSTKDFLLIRPPLIFEYFGIFSPKVMLFFNHEQRLIIITGKYNNYKAY